MDDIAIDNVDSQSPTTRIEGRFDPFRAMIAVLKLRGNEHVLAPSSPYLEHFHETTTGALGNSGLRESPW